MPKYWKSILWSLIILILLLLPGDKIPDHKLLQIKHFDKLIHAGLFGILQLLALFEAVLPSRLSKPHLHVLLICLVFAFVSELLQYLPFTGRDPSVYDLMADFLGLVAGIAVYKVSAHLKFLSFLRK